MVSNHVIIRQNDKTYTALKNAETALKDVHDWVVQALPVVDDIVIMNTCDKIGRRIIFVILLQSLLDLFRFIPTTATGLGLLMLRNLAQERNVTGREEIEASININNALPRLGTFPVDQGLEKASLLDHMV
jgi:Na+-transporting methylmalonyl-CoA/oxaloacetate decarboxylase beta subunit